MLYYTALHYASAGLVALLLYAYPFIVAVLAALFLRERLWRAPDRCAARCRGRSGADDRGGSGTAFGIMLGLGAALIYSLYIVGGTRVVREVDPLVASSIVCAAAATSLGALALWRLANGFEVAVPHDAAGWLPVVSITVVSTVLAITAMLVGLKMARRLVDLGDLDPGSRWSRDAGRARSCRSAERATSAGRRDRARRCNLAGARAAPRLSRAALRHQAGCGVLRRNSHSAAIVQRQHSGVRAESSEDVERQVVEGRRRRSSPNAHHC